MIAVKVVVVGEVEKIIKPSATFWQNQFCNCCGETLIKTTKKWKWRSHCIGMMSWPTESPCKQEDEASSIKLPAYLLPDGRASTITFLSTQNLDSILHSAGTQHQATTSWIC